MMLMLLTMIITNDIEVIKERCNSIDDPLDVPHTPF